MCNHFLAAVEGNKYGWFWKCPNGKECQYRHALPPGYILKKDRKKMEDFQDDEIPIEERIEIERTKIFMKGKGTKDAKETLTSLWAKLKKKEELAEKKKDELVDVNAREAYYLIAIRAAGNAPR